MALLDTLAPLLGTALAGPLGGAAATFIASKLGLSDSTVEAVGAVLNSGKMTPDQITQVKLAEIDFQKFLEANKIELAKLDVDDRASARAREAAVKDWIPGLLAVVVTAGFFGILSYMLTATIKPSDALLVMLGALGGAWASIISYYFGSSAGSAAKNQAIATALSK